LAHDAGEEGKRKEETRCSGARRKGKEALRRMKQKEENEEKRKENKEKGIGRVTVVRAAAARGRRRFFLFTVSAAHAGERRILGDRQRGV